MREAGGEGRLQSVGDLNTQVDELATLFETSVELAGEWVMRFPDAKFVVVGADEFAQVVCVDGIAFGAAEPEHSAKVAGRFGIEQNNAQEFELEKDGKDGGSSSFQTQENLPGEFGTEFSKKFKECFRFVGNRSMGVFGRLGVEKTEDVFCARPVQTDEGCIGEIGLRPRRIVFHFSKRVLVLWCSRCPEQRRPYSIRPDLFSGEKF